MNNEQLTIGSYRKLSRGITQTNFQLKTTFLRALLAWDVGRTTFIFQLSTKKVGREELTKEHNNKRTPKAINAAGQGLTKKKHFSMAKCTIYRKKHYLCTVVSEKRLLKKCLLSESGEQAKPFGSWTYPGYFYSLWLKILATKDGVCISADQSCL